MINILTCYLLSITCEKLTRLIILVLNLLLNLRTIFWVVLTGYHPYFIFFKHIKMPKLFPLLAKYKAICGAKNVLHREQHGSVQGRTMLLISWSL